MMRSFSLAIAFWLLGGLLAAAATRSVDVEKSTMTVHVYKSGFLSAFGHNHTIAAPIAQGSFDEENPSAQLRVDARQLRVVDTDVSDKDRATIQQTMLGPEVLDSQKFPEVFFHSNQVDRLGDGKWAIEGTLTLHGQTRPVKVQLTEQNGHYRGWAQLKQTDFGIKPVVVAGGTVKVKNEVRVEFDIVGK